MDKSATEYAKHLRAVQFSLAISSLALAAAILLGEKHDIEIAFDRAQEIESVSHQWAEQPCWIHEEAVNRAREMDLALDPNRQAAFHDRELETSNGMLRFRLDGPGILPLVDEDQWPVSSGDSESHSSCKEGLIQLNAPRTLLEFRRAWNQMDKPIEIVTADKVPSNGVMKLPRRKVVELRDATDADSRELRPIMIGSLRLTPIRSKKLRDFIQEEIGETYKHLAFVGGTLVGIVVPVQPVRLAAIDPQEVLISKFGVRWRMGSFEATFRELNEISADYQDVPLATLIRILKSERDRARQRVELFGIWLPQNSILMLGLPIIVVLQLYFAVHLAQFNNHRFRSVDFPWIGLYKTRAALVLSLGASSLLPVAVVVTVGLQEGAGDSTAQGLIVAWLLSVCSMIGALLCGRSLYEAWKSSGWQFHRSGDTHDERFPGARCGM